MSDTWAGTWAGGLADSPSAMTSPMPANVAGGSLRDTSVCSIAMTKSPEVSHASPWMRVTVAPGTNCWMRSCHCAARKSLCTSTSVLHRAWHAK